jgi:hypothetical protein
MTYQVKAANIVTTYMGPSIKEAQEVFVKSRVSCTLFKNDGNGNLSVIADKKIRTPNPISNYIN